MAEDSWLLCIDDGGLGQSLADSLAASLAPAELADGFGFLENLRQHAPGWRANTGPALVVGAAYKGEQGANPQIKSVQQGKSDQQNPDEQPPDQF